MKRASAIIAVPVSGGFVTAWCWNDGYPSGLGFELRKNWTKEEDVNQLLQDHSLSSILGKFTIQEFQRSGTITHEDTLIECRNHRYILQHPYNGNVVVGKGENGFFSSIEDMLEEQVYIYIFNHGKWKMHKEKGA